MSNPEEFIPIEVVSIQPGPQQPDGKQSIAGVNIFTMNVRRKHVAGINIVQEGPTPEVKTIVYFTADGGMKPVLSSESVEALIEKSS